MTLTFLSDLSSSSNLARLAVLRTGTAGVVPKIGNRRLPELSVFSRKTPPPPDEPNTGDGGPGKLPLSSPIGERLPPSMDKNG